MSKMHEDEIEVDEPVLHRLLAAQFPQWADLPVTRVAESGTDHALFRLGDDLVARLPRIAWADGQSALEAEWLPRLAPRLPLALSIPWRWASRTTTTRSAGRSIRGFPESSWTRREST